MYFFKNTLLYSWVLITQHEYIIVMTNEGSTKIVEFISPRTGVLVIGCDYISIQKL